jgi:hypothetical protein
MLPVVLPIADEKSRKINGIGNHRRFNPSGLVELD